jgi:hypothetical protein
MELCKSPRKAGSEFSSDFVPYQSPYEPSFFPLDDFPGQKFCAWGIFELVEDADEEVLAKLRAEGWEPWNDSNRKLFSILQLQLVQILLVSGKEEPPREWARTADIQFAADHPVLLTYQATGSMMAHVLKTAKSTKLRATFPPFQILFVLSLPS